MEPARDPKATERLSPEEDDEMKKFLEKVRSATPVLPYQKVFASSHPSTKSDAINEGPGNHSSMPRSKRDLQAFKVLRWEANSNTGKPRGNNSRTEEERTLEKVLNAGILKLALVLAWLGLGSIYTIPGVSLILLSCNSCIRLDLIILSFMCRAFGSLVGVIFMNVIASNAHLQGTLLVSTVCVGIATVAVPFVSSLPGILVLMWILGVVYGIAKQGFQMLGKHLGLREITKKMTELFFFCIGATLSSIYTFFSVGSFSVTEMMTAPHGRLNATQCQLVDRFYCTSGASTTNSILYFYTAAPLFLVAILIAVGLSIECKSKQKTSTSISSGNSGSLPTTINRSFLGIKCQMFVVYFLQDGIAYVLGYLVVIFLYLGKLPSTSMSNAIMASAIYWLSYCLGSVIVMAANQFINRNEKLYIMLGIKSIGSLVCSAIMAISESFPEFCVAMACYTVFMASAGEFGVNSIRSRCIVDYHTLTFITNTSTAFAEMVVPYLVFVLMDIKVAQFMTYSVAGLTLAMWIMCKVLIFSTITSSSDGWTVTGLRHPIHRSANNETQGLLENTSVQVKYTVDGWDIVE